MENTKSKIFLNYTIAGSLIVIVIATLYAFVMKPEIRSHKLNKCFYEVSKDYMDGTSNIYPQEVFNYQSAKESGNNSASITAVNEDIKNKIEACHEKYGN